MWLALLLCFAGADWLEQLEQWKSALDDLLEVLEKPTERYSQQNAHALGTSLIWEQELLTCANPCFELAECVKSIRLDELELSLWLMELESCDDDDWRVP